MKHAFIFSFCQRSVTSWSACLDMISEWNFYHVQNQSLAIPVCFVKCSVQAHFVTTGHISTRGSPPISENTDANIRNKPVPLFIPKGKKPEPVIALFFCNLPEGYNAYERSLRRPDNTQHGVI
jgi:hypothetical protein